MEQKKSYTLREDIVSMLKRSHVFAKAGDEVVIVADHGNVFIVEALNKDCFPVRPELLMEKESSEIKPAQLITATVPVPGKTKKQSKTKSVPPGNSNTLF